MVSQNDNSAPTILSPRRKALIAVLACFVLVGAGYFAAQFFDAKTRVVAWSDGNRNNQSFPDLTGNWLLEMDTIGKLTSAGSEQKTFHYPPGFSRRKVTVTIDEQEGFRFSGTIHGRNHEEVFVGVIGFGSAYANGVSEHGYFWVQFITTDKLDMIYHHKCPLETVAGRGIMTRQQ